MKSALLIFANHPLPVLTAEVLASGVADPLALALLKDTLRTLADVDADVFLFLDPGQDPSRDKDQARAVLGKGKFKIASALGRNRTVQQRNAFRLVFTRGYERALLLDNACPDLPAHAVQTALDTLVWKDACIGPVPSSGQESGQEPNQEAGRIYALGFHTEGWMTEAFDQVDHDRPALFSRLETLILFYARNVHVLPPYAPVTDLAQCPELARRCQGTRFAHLPSIRMAEGRLAGERPT